MALTRGRRRLQPRRRTRALDPYFLSDEDEWFRMIGHGVGAFCSLSALEEAGVAIALTACAGQEACVIAVLAPMWLAGSNCHHILRSNIF